MTAIHFNKHTGQAKAIVLKKENGRTFVNLIGTYLDMPAGIIGANILTCGITLHTCNRTSRALRTSALAQGRTSRYLS
jgi:hypothetical protein